MEAEVPGCPAWEDIECLQEQAEGFGNEMGAIVDMACDEEEAIVEKREEQEKPIVEKLQEQEKKQKKKPCKR
eukprot:10859934-Lingulodinium_polyedra.AAC.1